MPVEIERKFLVKGEAWKSTSSMQIRQGYLSRDPQRTVRIRVSGEQAWITVKGLTQGTVRDEFEYIIPVGDADALLAMCERPLLEKNRHRIQHGSHVWEVDEFLGDNTGQVIAEVELAYENESVELPPWAGDEVTNDPRYYNSNLTLRPYSEW